MKKKPTKEEIINALNVLPLGEKIEIAKSLKASIQAEIDEMKSRLEAATNLTDGL